MALLSGDHSPGVTDDDRFDQYLDDHKRLINARKHFEHDTVVASAEALLPQIESALMGPVGVNDRGASQQLQGLRYEVLSYAAAAAATIGRQRKSLGDWAKAVKFLDAMRVGTAPER